MTQFRTAFTLIDLIVVLTVLAAVGCLLVACTDNGDLEARRQRAEQRQAALEEAPAPSQVTPRMQARILQNNTNLRGIHQSMIVFAQNNKTGRAEGHFPGLSPEGEVLTTAQIAEQIEGDVQNDHHGGSVGGRAALMIYQNVVSPEILISPIETDDNIRAYERGRTFDLNHRNYSYAMLEIGNPTDGRSDDRAVEWSETINSRAIVLSDRVLGEAPIGDTPAHHSHLTAPGSGEWRGGVAWNDNRVETATGIHHETRYGFNRHERDNIFVAAGSDDACLTHPDGADACD